eukprot:12056001-Prorocentrum_lima.AAC.1
MNAPLVPGTVYLTPQVPQGDKPPPHEPPPHIQQSLQPTVVPQSVRASPAANVLIKTVVKAPPTSAAVSG